MWPSDCVWPIPDALFTGDTDGSVLRTALLGAGGIGSRLARLVVDHPAARLAAVVDVDTAGLDRVAEDCDLDAATLYTDSETMYAETAPDAVVVATPPAFHDEALHAASTATCTSSVRSRSWSMARPPDDSVTVSTGRT